MRRKLTALLLVLACLPAAARDVVQASNQTSASSLAAETQPVVMPTTPSGTGDPNATVCRAPQHMVGSDQLGSQVCLHNSEWWKVAMNGKDIAPDGKTLIDRPTVKNPTGEGDPDAITCRTPQFVDRGQPVKVCRLNSFWADVIKNRQVVDAQGNVVTARSNLGYGSMPLPGFNFGQWAQYDSGHVQSGQLPPPSSFSPH